MTNNNRNKVRQKKAGKLLVIPTMSGHRNHDVDGLLIQSIQEFDLLVFNVDDDVLRECNDLPKLS